VINQEYAAVMMGGKFVIIKERAVQDIIKLEFLRPVEFHAWFATE
jgi:hypothetical protein